MDLNYRLATMEDADLLLKLKNDPDVRAFSIVTHKRINKKDHLKWLKKTLTDPRRKLFVIEYNGIPCGDIRFDIEDGTAEVSIRLAKEYRGLGIGTQAIAEAGTLMLFPLRAKVVDGNVSSLKIFLKNGYEIVGYATGPDIGYYTLRE